MSNFHTLLVQCVYIQMVEDFHDIPPSPKNKVKRKKKEKFGKPQAEFGLGSHNISTGYLAVFFKCKSLVRASQYSFSDPGIVSAAFICVPEIS